MRFLATALFVSLISAAPADVSAGEIKTYQHGDTVLEGYWVPASCETPKGTVLVTHQWMGLGDYEKGRADMLAEDCYNAFAVDVYGQGIRPANRQEAAAASSKYKSNPDLARDRMNAAVEYVKTLPGVDADYLAAIGYCFGGTMVLELARSGADLDGVVSFHGGLKTSAPATEDGSIKSAIQVHHGDADPYVPKEEVAVFKEEMRKSNSDWHFIGYADAVHAFTEKEAGNDPSKGAAYNKKADIRSWAYTHDFLEEIFSE